MLVCGRIPLLTIPDWGYTPVCISCLYFSKSRLEALSTGPPLTSASGLSLEVSLLAVWLFVYVDSLDGREDT